MPRASEIQEGRKVAAKILLESTDLLSRALAELFIVIVDAADLQALDRYARLQQQCLNCEQRLATIRATALAGKADLDEVIQLDKLGVTRVTISYWESGKCEPDLDSRQKLHAELLLPMTGTAHRVPLTSADVEAAKNLVKCLAPAINGIQQVLRALGEED